MVVDAANSRARGDHWCKRDADGLERRRHGGVRDVDHDPKDVGAGDHCPEQGGRWLHKMPFHLMELATLMATYPDALLIQTHREPAPFMGSWNSLVERIRSLRAWCREAVVHEQDA